MKRLRIGFSMFLLPPALLLMLGAGWLIRLSYLVFLLAEWVEGQQYRTTYSEYVTEFFVE